MALSNKKIALLVACVVSSIALIFAAIFATDMIFGKEGEYKFIIDIIQLFIAGGVVFGGVMVYRAFAKELPPVQGAETSMSLGVPTSRGGMEGIFQGGVHNPFASM